MRRLPMYSPRTHHALSPRHDFVEREVMQAAIPDRMKAGVVQTVMSGAFVGRKDVQQQLARLLALDADGRMRLARLGYDGD